MDPLPDSTGLPPDTEQIFEVQPDTPGNSDEELAGLMADPEVVESVAEGDSAGAVEASAAEGETEEVEHFSMDDFEDGFADVQNGEDVASQETPAPLDPTFAIPSSPAPAPADDGVVAGFRRALAGLAAQAELDRIAFLRDDLAQRGEPVPGLDEIVADVTGEKLLSPEGDCDLYGRRPAARLEGWKVGLAFGSPRRAKRYNKS